MLAGAYPSPAPGLPVTAFGAPSTPLDRRAVRGREVCSRCLTVSPIQQLKSRASSGIKLSSVATDIMGVSGRAMLAALIDGHDDPAAIAELAQRRMRSKIPMLTEALTGRFTAHHGFLIRMHLGLIDQYSQALTELDARISEAMEPLAAARELLISIPGISTTVAEVLLAETGGDMRV